MILYVVGGGSCYVKTKDHLIIGSEDVGRLGVDFFINSTQFTCAVITEKISVKDFLYSLSRVILSPPKHLASLKVLSKAVVATTDGIEFGKCFPVRYASVNDLKRHFDEYWS